MSAVRPLLAIAVLLATSGTAFAAPANAGCETQTFAMYCDSPARPDGTFDRCQTTYGQSGYPSFVPPTSRCYPVDPAQPWPMFPLAQPQYHIYP
jgi:hypothetical protein